MNGAPYSSLNVVNPQCCFNLSLIHTDAPTCTHLPQGGPMQFCTIELLCVYVTWPLPFHAIVQQTDAVPPSTLIIPVIPISTVPAEPAVIPPSTSQVFFLSFSIFTLPLPSFCSLSVGHFLIPAIPLLTDGAEGLSAPESGKVWRLSLTNSICVSTSRRKWKAPKKDRQTDSSEQERELESGFNFRLLWACNSIHASALHVLQSKTPCTYVCWLRCINLVRAPVLVYVASCGE